MIMNLPQISDAEFEVMNVIWKYAPINTNDIVDRLSKDKDWSPKTIQTMLFRLEKKGVITHEKESRIFVYAPIPCKSQRKPNFSSEQRIRLRKQPAPGKDLC